jgi:putative hemolysin
MWDIPFEIAVIVLLAIANGVFAMSEIAVVSARKARLQHRAAAGDERARAALDLATAPDRFLATVQVGITLIGILAGAFGGATLANRLAVAFAALPWLAPHAGLLAFWLIVIFVTFISLVIGELVPKNIALAHPEAIARFVARPMRRLAAVAYPLVALLRSSSGLILRLLHLRAGPPTPVTEEEIKIMLDQGTQAGVFEPAERTLLERVFRLGDRRVGSLMTPRTDIVWIDVHAPIGESMRRMTAAPHTYFPLCDGGIENVIGVVSVKDQWARMVNKLVPDLRATVVSAPYVPESMTALKLLETFRHSGRHIALVIDEYGGLSGLVTLTDVMGAIVGDIPSGHADEDQSIVRRADGSYLMDGMLAVDEFRHVLALDKLPGEEGAYQTLAGLCIHQLGRVPRVGDYFAFGGLRFEIVDMDGHRVDRVLVAPRPAATTTGDGTEPQRHRDTERSS